MAEAFHDAGHSLLVLSAQVRKTRPVPGSAHEDHDHDQHADHDDGHATHSHAGHSGHAGHHHHIGDGSLRVVAGAAVGNLALAILQLVVGVFSGSVALLADTAHQMVDVVGLVIAAVSMRLAKKETATWSTYGWGRLDPAGALISSTLLIGASIWVAIESIRRLNSPEPIKSGWVIIVALVGLVVNGGSMFGLLRKGGESMSTKAAVLHLGGDAVGSVGVLIAGLFARRGLNWVDPVVALLLGVAITFSAVRLLRSAFLVLLDATPQGMDVDQLISTLTDYDHVIEVHHLHVWDVKPNERAMTAHVRVANELTLHDGQELADNLRVMVKDRYSITHATFEVECHECTHASH
jgi:cobalt-zinc-cadmium efflux system protein